MTCGAVTFDRMTVPGKEGGRATTGPHSIKLFTYETDILKHFLAVYANVQITGRHSCLRLMFASEAKRPLHKLGYLVQ